jgi:hypothetical protein
MAKILYQYNHLDYTAYKDTIIAANERIRLYDYCLKLAFNDSICELRRMGKYAIWRRIARSWAEISMAEKSWPH